MKNINEKILGISLKDVMERELTPKEISLVKAKSKYYQTLMKLKEQRSKLGISQHDLAQRSGVSRTTITRIEEGKHNPTLETIFNLTESLDMELHPISR